MITWIQEDGKEKHLKGKMKMKRKTLESIWSIKWIKHVLNHILNITEGPTLIARNLELPILKVLAMTN